MAGVLNGRGRRRRRGSIVVVVVVRRIKCYTLPAKNLRRKVPLFPPKLIVVDIGTYLLLLAIGMVFIICIHSLR